MILITVWKFTPLFHFVPDIYDLERVSLHEFGHSIGLDHSNVPGTIMMPFYPFFDLPRAQLTPDDIAGANLLYPGEKSQRRNQNKLL